jgi:hypothetical protein
MPSCWAIWYSTGTLIFGTAVMMRLAPRRETIGTGLGPAALSACRETAHPGATAKRPDRCIAEQAEGMRYAY